MFEIFRDFEKNLFRAFRGLSLFWHILAIALTYVFVVSGLDWRYFEATRSADFQTFFWPAVQIGFLFPILGIPIFLILRLIRKNQKELIIISAVAQAALIGFLISDFYKFFTGRPGLPHIFENTTLVDTSHVFRFGILRGGLFFGWPSSHTTVAFAMAFALIFLFPKNKPLRYLAILYALYIGLGVSVTIHWFSDFFAGAIIGSVVGMIAGCNFRNYLHIKPSD